MASGLFIAGRITGMLAGAALTALWVAVIWFPVEGFMLEGVSVLVGAFLALAALIATIASWHGHAAVIFACFVPSFFGVGAFALNVNNWFRIFGILDLLLLLASVMIWYSARNKETRQ